MEISAAVAADLATLSRAMHDPALDDTDLEEVLRAFAHDIKIAVPSYSGMSLRITSSVGDFSLTAMEDMGASDDIAASLHLPLADGGSTVTLYAGLPGAFADLAAYLDERLHPGARIVAVDGHLGAPAAGSAGEATLASLSLINQAVGLLIERGFSRENADRELRRRARYLESSLLEVAVGLLAAAQRGPPSETSG